MDQQRKVFQFAQPRDSFILLLWNRACIARDWFSQTWPESPCAHTLKGLSRRWQVRVETVGRLAEAHCRNVQYKRRLRAKIRVRLRSKARSQGLRVCAPVGGSPPQQYMRHSSSSGHPLSTRMRQQFVMPPLRSGCGHVVLWGLSSRPQRAGVPSVSDDTPK